MKWTPQYDILAWAWVRGTYKQLLIKVLEIHPIGQLKADKIQQAWVQSQQTLPAGVISETPSLRAIKERIRLLRNSYPAIKKEPSASGGADVDLGLDLGSGVRGGTLQGQGKVKGGKVKNEWKEKKMQDEERSSLKANNEEEGGSQGVEVKKEGINPPELEEGVKVKKEESPPESEDGGSSIRSAAATIPSSQQNKRRVTVAASGWHECSESAEAVAERIRKRRSVIGSGGGLGSVGIVGNITSALGNDLEGSEDGETGFG